VVKKLNKLKIICGELRRNITLDVFLSKNIQEPFENKENAVILIRVENFEEGTVYYWNTETFYNRYDMMKDLFDKYQDEDLDLVNLKHEEDPLWDEHKPTLLGFSVYKLEPLAYLMNNPTTSTLISPNGNTVGSIVYDIIPIDDEGNLHEEIPDDPNELIGQPLNFKVHIKECKDLPEYFCRDVQVEYSSFYDNVVNRTKPLNSKTKNPVFDEFFEHRIEYLTKDDIDYLLKEKLLFRVFSFEEVVKKGKLPLELRMSTNDLPTQSKMNSNQEYKPFQSNVNINYENNQNRNNYIINNIPTVRQTVPEKNNSQYVKSKEPEKKEPATQKDKKNEKKSSCITF